MAGEAFAVGFLLLLGFLIGQAMEQRRTAIECSAGRRVMDVIERIQSTRVFISPDLRVKAGSSWTHNGWRYTLSVKQDRADPL